MLLRERLIVLISSSSISKPLGDYVLEHYPALPAHAVYPPSSSSSDYTILIVGNKYNNPNYWYPPHFVGTDTHFIGTDVGDLCTSTIPRLRH